MKMIGWLKKNVVPLITLVLILALSSAIFIFYINLPERITELSGYGYLGAFLLSIIFNATVILPAGNFLVLFTLGGVLPLPIIVGLIGAVGAAIGEMTGYAAGHSGRTIIAKQAQIYTRLEHQVKRWGSLAIFVLSILPLVFDLVGIAAGALRFPLWKFFIFCWLGRTVLYVLIALSGSWGLEVILPYIG